MVYIAIVLAVFSADMMLKRYVEENLGAQEERQYLNGNVHVRKVHNHGMLLGAFKDKPKTVRRVTGTVLIVAAVRLITAVFSKKKERRAGKLALAFIVGGALSNWFDHFHQGYVVDYVNIKTPVRFLKKIYFNLADFFILAGALIAAMFDR
ncbi:MAG: signal peptidase II [Eubacterium sp.]|nr:signal peptidase II [Eubacterium sp.]